MKSNFSFCSILLCMASVLQAQSWSGFGTNGTAFAIEAHNGVVYAGGDFTDAGGDPDADCLVRWDGCTWHSMGGGFNGVVYAIAVMGQDVYVGGHFSQPYSNIARWDGSNWYPVGQGLPETVFALLLSGSTLFAGGGKLFSGGFVASWNGSEWTPIGPPLNSVVADLAIYEDVLYMTGPFTDAGGNPDADGIAMYVDEKWQNLGTGLNGSIWLSPGIDLLVHEDTLYVTGEFSSAGGNTNIKNIGKWDGTSWSALGQGPPYPGNWGMRYMTVFQDQLYVSAGAGWSDAHDGFYRWSFDTQEWDFFQHYLNQEPDVSPAALTSDEENIYYSDLRGIWRWGPPWNPEDCNTTSSTPITSTSRVQAFPNPVPDRLFLDYDVRDYHTGSLEVMDDKGIQVMHVSGLKHDIDLSTLPSAIYTIRIRIDDHVEMIRVVKL